MKAYVVVATKGRAPEAYVLLTRLRQQTLPPSRIIVVGTCEDDIEGLDGHEGVLSGQAELRISPVPGSCDQRNLGLRLVDLTSNPCFVVFFDDDFRPHEQWLENAAHSFAEHGDVVGLTGNVLADGVKEGGIAEEDAVEYLTGSRPSQPHWASGEQSRDVGSVYGCNMAFRDVVLKRCAFDEELVLYGWQEDRDLTGQARKFGRVIYEPQCRGVHLGVSSGRTSGLRFGYSQIVNVIYLARKGTTDWKTAMRFATRSLLSNMTHSVWNKKDFDYRGRLLGNGIAVLHVLTGRAQPSFAKKL